MGSPLSPGSCNGSISPNLKLKVCRGYDLVADVLSAVVKEASAIDLSSNIAMSSG